MSRLEKGTLVPLLEIDKAAEADLARIIASALRREFHGRRAMAKTVAHWTGVSDRTVKKWLAGEAVPGGRHLVALMKNSGAVFQAILREIGR